MGSDNLHFKQRVQKAEQLKRAKGDRTLGPRFLIVCEGQRTEPNYFQDLCSSHNLKTARVRVAPGGTGSSPDCVVAHAEELFDDDAKLGGDPYDRVFCVIDRDKHATYEAALQRIEKLHKKNKPFEAVQSIPCFEYWLLLHFTASRQLFHSTGTKSICELVIKALRRQTGFSTYNKGMEGIYKLLQDKLPIALKNAARVERDVEQTNEANPSTRIHHLVIRLQALATNQ